MLVSIDMSFGHSKTDSMVKNYENPIYGRAAIFKDGRYYSSMRYLSNLIDHGTILYVLANLKVIHLFLPSIMAVVDVLS